MNTKLICWLAVALGGVVSVATGCKHESVGVTPMPTGMPLRVPGVGPGGSISQGKQPIPVETNWTVETMKMDRATLAADTVHFDYDSAVVRDSEQADIKAVASALSSDPDAKLLVEGNCDERGTEEYNRSLGERRALSSREALATLGIDPTRVCTISYGKDKPKDSGHDETAWKENRRDDFVLLHPKTEIETNAVSYDP